MKELEKEFFEFLDSRKQEVLSEAAALVKDDRKDESNILQAKANIYDIFKALWTASKNTTSDLDGFKAAFLNKAAAIPSAGEGSLAKAKEHNDTFQVLIEEAQLSAVAAIKGKFAEMF